MADKIQPSNHGLATALVIASDLVYRFGVDPKNDEEIVKQGELIGRVVEAIILKSGVHVSYFREGK